MVGITDRSGADAGVDRPRGTSGVHRSLDGSGIGVLGVTLSDASGAYGVLSDGDSRTVGNHEVTGSVTASEVGASDRVTMGNVGAEVFRDSDQTVTDRTETRVKFNVVQYDPASEYDDTNHEFVCADAGSYHVDVQVNWNGLVPSDTNIILRIKVSGATIARYEADTGGSDRQVTNSVSRAAHNVDAGDKIYATVHQNSGIDLDINGAYRYLTYMTISYLG